MSVSWENVYIFISSTFNDMHAERDYLVKSVFPALSEWCESHKLRLVDIDLRWGVTAADSEAKNTVKACLHSIDKCRPFFLCFLGQRRGWVPHEDEIGADTYDLFPRLTEKNYAGEASVTEMEILHALVDPLHNGILRGMGDTDRSGQAVEHAFFFLRDAGYLAGVTHPGLRAIYTNEGERDKQTADDELLRWRNEEIPQTGRPMRAYTAKWQMNENTPEIALPICVPTTAPKDSEAWSQAFDRWKRQWASLEIDVDDSGEITGGELEKALAYNESFTQGRLGNFTIDGCALAEIVIEQLKEAIRKRYKERFSDSTAAEDSTPLQKEIDQQALFLRIAGEGFIERVGDFDALNEYLQNNERRPLAVTAFAGMGKTSLLAHFIETYSIRPGESLHYRFIGGSDDSVSVERLVYSLLIELKEAGKIEGDIPVDSVEMMNKLPGFLTEAGGTSKTILIIDALNQLQSGMSDLYWIPSALPENVKLIVSFKRGEEAADTYYRRQKESGGMIVHEVKPFEDAADRRALVESYLEQYLKELDEPRIQTLISTEGAENPLFLKVALSELRVFGVHNDLSEVIRSRFGNTPVLAFHAILARMESDPSYTNLAPGIALPHVLGWIVHSRYGLSVDELVELLMREHLTDCRDDARDAIYLIFRQLRAFLAKRDGRVDFFYESFKTAATERYTVGHIYAREANDWHKSLAGLFRQLCDPHGDGSFESDNIRALVELGYHTCEFDFDKGERLYSGLPYLDARCSKDSPQRLLTELNRFASGICREFFSIIMRFQAILSSCPNSLFSICRASTSSPVFKQSESLLASGGWSKAWLETVQLLSIANNNDDEKAPASDNEITPAMALSLIAKSEPCVHNTGCVFSPAGSIFIFSQTLERLRVFDSQNFEMLPCIIHVRPVRIESIRFSDDSNYIAVAHEDLSVELFRLQFDKEGAPEQAICLEQGISCYKPKRGFSSYGFSNNCICYQPDENTICAYNLDSLSYADLWKAEQPFILDAVIPFNGSTYFSVRQRVSSAIICYSHADMSAAQVMTLDSAYTIHSCVLSENHFAIVLSDNRVVVYDTYDKTAIERTMDVPVKSVCPFEQKMLILYKQNELLLWDWRNNETVSVFANTGEERFLNNPAAHGDEIMALLGASIAKFEIKKESPNYAGAIISVDELPELTAAVNDGNCGVTIQKNAFCSEVARLEERVKYSACLTSGGAYILSEFGGGFYLAPGQTRFEKITDTGQAIRLLHSFSSQDGCVYYIDTLWNLRCRQSDFSYDLSRYHFSAINIRAFDNYVLLFGTAGGAQATSGAATGHEVLSGTLLIFQVVQPGFLRFYGERLFSAAYGAPADAAFHEKTGRIYVIFNTPHSAKSRDLLQVCYGTKEELVAGNGSQAKLNIPRMLNTNPSTACTVDSYLVCYQGNVYSYDAISLEYQAAIAADGSFNGLQSARNSSAYALAVCSNSTGICRISKKQ